MRSLAYLLIAGAMLGPPLTSGAFQNAGALPGSTISGQVRDANGQPAPGVKVEVFEPVYRNGRRMLSPAARPPGEPVTRTDSHGEYRVSGLRSGAYYVRIEVPAFGGGQRVASYSTFYPESPAPDRAARIELQEGGHARLDFRIPGEPKDPGVKVSGKVSLEQPEASRFVVSAIALLPRDDNALYANYLLPFPNTLKDGDGRFEIRGVQPGSYDLFAMLSSDALEERLYGRTPVTVQYEDIEDVLVFVPPNVASVQGTVAVKGEPSAITLESLEIQLAPDYAPNGDPVGVNTDGSFEIRNMAPAKYRLTVHGLPAGTVVEDITQGGRSAFDRGIVVIDRGAEPIRVVISATGAVVQGIVIRRLDRNTVAGATVGLVPSRTRLENLSLYKSTASGSDGTFAFAGVAPGDYQLFAWENAPAGAYQNIEFLKVYEGLGQSISVSPAAYVNVSLQVIPSAPSLAR